MSTSTSSPAPASSPPGSSSFPVGMVGRPVELFLLYREAKITGVQRQDVQELTRINFTADGLISSGNNWRMETTDGLKFHGDVEVDENSTMEASIRVMDNEVQSCCCCTELGVPTPPFSPDMVGMKFRFSEPDPHIINATVQEVEKRSTLTVVNLQMTSEPPYSACMGDRVMLASDLDSWEADVAYFGDKSISVRNLENKICIHVRDEHVPQGPKFLPHTKIFVRPAGGGLAHLNIGHQGREVPQRKRRLSARDENKANQKIKVAIHGYRDVGRALTRVALDSDDVDLVAIHDFSITDQTNCMFKDSKVDFEVKSNSSNILLFGEKEVTFYRESNPLDVLRHKLVVTTSNSSKEEVAAEKKFASVCSRTSDSRVSAPLEIILGTSDSTFLENPWSPILRIRPISQSDAKAVSDCFPLWKGKQVVSIVCFQGIGVIFDLGCYPDYPTMPNSTQPSIDFKKLVRWCFHMLSRIPNAVCDVEMSEWPHRGCR